jgi:hypothetical protein
MLLVVYAQAPAFQPSDVHKKAFLIYYNIPPF